MKLPNGYGSVVKLSGTRRKPYAARITTGWDSEPRVSQKTGKPYVNQNYIYIGYFAKRSEALAALADYHKNPNEIKKVDITFDRNKAGPDMPGS